MLGKYQGFFPEVGNCTVSWPPPSSPGPSGESGLFPAPAMPPGRLFENKPHRRVLVPVSRRLLEGLVRPALDQAQWEVDTATACQELRVHEGVDTRPQCPAHSRASKARGPQWGLSLLCTEWPSLAHLMACLADLQATPHSLPHRRPPAVSRKCLT